MGLGKGAARGAPPRELRGAARGCAGLCGAGGRCPLFPGSPPAQVRRDTEICPVFPSRGKGGCLFNFVASPSPAPGAAPGGREDREAAVGKVALDVHLFILIERKGVINKKEERC